jgi:hypothetical protein
MIMNMVTVKNVEVFGKGTTSEWSKVSYFEADNDRMFIKNVFSSTDGYSLLVNEAYLRFSIEKQGTRWEIVKIEDLTGLNVPATQEGNDRNKVYNRITLIGILGNTPQFSIVQVAGKDVSVCNFTLYVDNDAYQVKAWDKRAEDYNQWLHKYSRAFVDGTQKLKTYINKGTGKEVTELQVTAKEVIFL